MTIELHPECRDRVVELVADALAPTSLAGSQFPDDGLYSRLADADEALPDRTSLTDRLHSFIGDTPVTTFVVQELYKDLKRRFEYEPQVRIDLTDMEGFEDPTAVAEDLIARLETLPWHYELMVPLPRPLGDAVLTGADTNTIQLSGRLHLSAYDAATVAQLPENEGPEGLGLLFDPRTTIHEGQLTVVETVDGYVGDFSSTRPVEDFRFKVRAILGVLLALRMAVTGMSTPKSSPQGIRVHQLRDGKRVSLPDRTFSPEFTREFQALQVNRIFQKWRPKVKKFAAERNRTHLKALFAHEDHHESVIRGAQWLFDGFCSGSNLLAFVQTAVSMEILMGEDRRTTDLVGLGNLIGNRCAYLIAPTREERSEIIDDFQKAYRIRSRIVHEGKNRLSSSERSALSSLRWMCYRVIQEELEMMAGD